MNITDHKIAVLESQLAETRLRLFDVERELNQLRRAFNTFAGWMAHDLGAHNVKKLHDIASREAAYGQDP